MDVAVVLLMLNTHATATACPTNQRWTRATGFICPLLIEHRVYYYSDLMGWCGVLILTCGLIKTYLLLCTSI